MQLYKDYAPTEFDRKGLSCQDQQDWLVLIGQNRDSDALGRSNFEAAKAILQEDPENTEILRFGHWACGWIEVLIVKPKTKACDLAEDIERALADYPVLDEELFFEYEHNEASDVWANCYDISERIAYIRENKSQFEFHTLTDLIHCVRGDYFNGYASELLS